LTKKSEVVLKEEKSLPVLEAELIDDEVTHVEKTDLSRRDKLPLAYTLGKVFGYVGTFLVGFLKSKEILNAKDVDKGSAKGARGRRFREKRRGKRRNR